MSTKKQSGAFPLVAGGKASVICVDAKEERVVKIAATAFVHDVNAVTGVATGLDSSGRTQPVCVVVGTVGNSRLVDDLVTRGKLNVSTVSGRWETFGISVVENPFGTAGRALVIFGSDPRGTAYGVFELSARMGVSPFYWWADVTPERKTDVYITKGDFRSRPPSVKYRGIFINDEDWGLQPWAAKTFEPETGDIGPKTYAKVFELLLRLKANLIWPAMHPSTKAFFHYPGNVIAAADYAIVIGSSHAEPMLRNNVGEWDEKTMGHFNYVTNKESVYRYWEERVKQSSGINALYTVGMRGVHDSKMEGVKDEKEAVPLLERIMADQRDLLRRYLGKDVTAIPQVLTAYKEVLDIYDAGLKVPDDVTLVWPDDNYGYVQRLNNEKEKARSGGSGVYYHASYWGRPHDYLWLGSTHPSLVREEMMKAYAAGADRLWVVNVGDIKPLEYNVQQFLDMAYNAEPFRNSRSAKTHLRNWVESIFDRHSSAQISDVLWQYYNLAFERRPEFMGWSRTEPTTPTTYTAYNHFYYGDEAQKRIDAYESLERQVKALKGKLADDRKAAFYQLVYYPVVGASWMNKKFLYRDKAVLYAAQNRRSALDYAAMSNAAYDSIVKETEYFNTKLSGGKWKGVISMKPRDLPVYQPPVLPNIELAGGKGWSVSPEGFIAEGLSLLEQDNGTALPAFDNVHRQRFFVDVFLCDNRPVAWTAVATQPWIRLSQASGRLLPQTQKNQVRTWVSIDWSKAPKGETLNGQVVFKSGDRQTAVAVQARRLQLPDLNGYKGFVENNGFVSIHAANFSRQSSVPSGQWQVLEDIGYAGKCLQFLPATGLLVDTAGKNSAAVEYDFYTFTGTPIMVNVFALPTHPLNNKYRMRYTVSVDNGPARFADLRTVGRSEEWKQNVLANRAKQQLAFPALKPGKHTLKIVAIDPGVVLDEIRIDLGGLKKAYGVLPETR